MIGSDERYLVLGAYRRHRFHLWTAFIRIYSSDVALFSLLSALIRPALCDCSATQPFARTSIFSLFFCCFFFGENTLSQQFVCKAKSLICVRGRARGARTWKIKCNQRWLLIVRLNWQQAFMNRRTTHMKMIHMHTPTYRPTHITPHHAIHFIASFIFHLAFRFFRYNEH